MNTETILGLDRLGSPTGQGYKHILLSKAIVDNSIKLGTPGIVLTRNYNGNMTTMSAIILFPFQNCARGRFIYEVNKNKLIERNIKDFVSTHNTIEIGDDISGHIINDGIITAQKHGPVSFIMSIKAGKELMLNMHKWLLSKFIYNLVYSYDSQVGIHKGIIPVLSIFDITHCIPIFNTDKVDGIGVIYEGFMPNSNGSISNNRSFYVLLILSKYRENLHYVDGVYTDTRRWSSDMSKHILRTLEACESPIAKKAKAKKTETLQHICYSDGFTSPSPSMTTDWKWISTESS